MTPSEVEAYLKCWERLDTERENGVALVRERWACLRSLAGF